MLGRIKHNDDFEMRIKELRRLYDMNPNETINVLDQVISNTDLYRESSNDTKSAKVRVFQEIGGIKLAYIVIITILVLAGFLNLGENTMMHIFGLVFFLAGFFVGKSTPGVGLIFLFSHGCTGLGLMIGGVFALDFYRGILTDLSKGVQTYLTLGIIAIVVAIFMMIFYNLSPTLRKNNKLPVISLGLFALSVVMVNLLPHIYDDVIRILG